MLFHVVALTLRLLKRMTAPAHWIETHVNPIASSLKTAVGGLR